MGEDPSSRRSRAPEGIGFAELYGLGDFVPVVPARANFAEVQLFQR
nr:MAG TPA: hypothetical protein [Caudoviricetes sp.]